TPAGSVIVLDDTSGKEKIIVRAKPGCDITIDPGAGTITVKAGTVLVQSDGGEPQELATKAFVTEVYDTHKHRVSGAATTIPDTLSATKPTALTKVLKGQ